MQQRCLLRFHRVSLGFPSPRLATFFSRVAPHAVLSLPDAVRASRLPRSAARSRCRAKAVMRFAERVARSPQQVVRYAYEGQPLWSVSDPPKDEVPPCACGEVWDILLCRVESRACPQLPTLPRHLFIRFTFFLSVFPVARPPPLLFVFFNARRRSRVRDAAHAGPAVAAASERPRGPGTARPRPRGAVVAAAAAAAVAAPGRRRQDRCRSDDSPLGGRSEKQGWRPRRSRTRARRA